MLWKWSCKSSIKRRTLFIQLQLPVKLQEGNVIFQVGIQSLSLPNCCLGNMGFLITIDVQALIINAMWILPVSNMVPVGWCEKDWFVNQRGKSATVELHTFLPSFLPWEPIFFLVYLHIQIRIRPDPWSFVIWLVSYSRKASRQLLSPLFGEQRGTGPASCHVRIPLGNWSLTAPLWLLVYHTFQKANSQISSSGSKMLV